MMRSLTKKKKTTMKIKKRMKTKKSRRRKIRDPMWPAQMRGKVKKWTRRTIKV